MTNNSFTSEATCEMPVNYLHQTLGSIAAIDLQKAQVFRKYGLDFCCGGKKTVLEACRDKGIDATEVAGELRKTVAGNSLRQHQFNEWEPGFLADYIVNEHHAYVRKNLPELLFYSNKVMKVHGKEHPELQEINRIVFDVSNELTSHMAKEENILFPYIKELSKSQLTQSSIPSFGTVQNPVSMMEAEHEVVGELLASARKLTDNYTLPEGACASYTFLYRLLDEFEQDLHIHVHLENNILFPKALQLEKGRIS